jgi:putative spermidine/putrescine transport system substrate-binding protein
MNWSLTPKVQGDVAAWFGSLPVVPQGCKASALLGDKGCETNGYNEFQNCILENAGCRRGEIRAL